MVIFREKEFCKVGNAVGDKKCRKNINSIMQVSHKYRHTQCERQTEKEEASNRLIPEDERHEKGHAGVPGKEKIAAKRDPGERIMGRKYHTVNDRFDMRAGDEERTDEDKKRNALQKKRKSFRLRERYGGDDKKKRDGTIDKDVVHIKNGYVAQYQIGYLITGALRRIDAGEVIRHQTCGKQKQAAGNRHDPTPGGEKFYVSLGYSHSGFFSSAVGAADFWCHAKDVVIISSSEYFFCQPSS